MFLDEFLHFFVPTETGINTSHRN